MTLSFVDETTAGTRSPVFEITVNTDFITVQQLIEIRIHEDILRKKFDSNALVNREMREAGIRASKGPSLPNEKTQVEVACKAFLENRLLVLLKDRQATTLDERLPLSEGDEVSFLRLIPLIGG